jgi:hypothetical protein
MVTDSVKQVIGFFYPAQDPDEVISRIVLEWVDTRIMHMEESIREYERKYRMAFPDFDKKIKEQGAVYEEEDDWIDWSDTIDLVDKVIKIRDEVFVIGTDMKTA